MNDLIVLDKINPIEVFTDKGLDPVLKQIKAEVDKFEPDLTTKTSRKKIASMAAKVASSKTYLDDLGKQLNKDKRTEIDAVDAERKRMRDNLDALKKEVRQPLTDFENDEISRVEKLELRILDIKALDKLYEIGAPVEEIRGTIAEAQAIVIDDTWQEFEDQAAEEKASVLMSLAAKLEMNVKAAEQAAQFIKLQEEVEEARIENERLEAARLKQEAADNAERNRVLAAQEQKAREAQLVADATEKARVDAEDASRQATERLEQEVRESQEREVRAKIEAENAVRDARNLIETEKRIEEEATKRREEDVKHRRAVNQTARDALVAAGVGEVTATKVITAIAKGDVPAVAISY